MELEQEELEKLQECAGLLMNINDIAVLMDIDPDELRESINNKFTEASKAYQKGKVQFIYEIRKQELDLAKLGSPQAVEQMHKYMIDQKIQENG